MWSIDLLVITFGDKGRGGGKDWFEIDRSRGWDNFGLT